MVVPHEGVLSVLYIWLAALLVGFQAFGDVKVFRIARRSILNMCSRSDFSPLFLSHVSDFALKCYEYPERFLHSFYGAPTPIRSSSELQTNSFSSPIRSSMKLPNPGHRSSYPLSYGAPNPGHRPPIRSSSELQTNSFSSSFVAASFFWVSLVFARNFTR